MTKKVDTIGWRRQDFLRFYTETWKAPVIPIGKSWGEWDGEGKKALVLWTELQNRLNTASELDSWFREKQPYGVSMVCGAVAGNLFSIDIDKHELYIELKEAGAFPPPACIYKSPNGYHVIMRSDIIPFSVKEHNATLSPEFWELGISGDRGLSHMPDTPGREWIQLYEEPLQVNYEEWLKKYLNYSRNYKKEGRDVYMICPYHLTDNGDSETTPSLSVNAEKGVFHCLACGHKGTISTLLSDSKTMGFRVPSELLEQIITKAEPKGFRADWSILPDLVGTAGDDIVEGILPAGANGKTLITALRKMGKTTFGLSVGIPISRGEPCLGGRKTRRKRVCFIDLEQTSQAVYEMMSKQVPVLGRPEKGWFDVIGGQDFKVLNDESMKLLWSLLSQKPTPEVIIFDSIYAMVENPNEYKEAVAVRDLMTRCIAELGASIMVLHHTNDPADVSINRKPEGVLGRMLDKWCGVTLKYVHIGDGEPEESYYRRLHGTRRGGGKYAIMNIALAYIADFMILVEQEWTDIPGSNEDKAKIIGLNERTRMVVQVCFKAVALRITKRDLAGEWGVSDRQVYNYQNGTQIPSDDVHQKILATNRRLGELMSGKDSEQGSADNHAEGVHTVDDSAEDLATNEVKRSTEKGVVRGSGSLSDSQSNININYKADCKHCPLKGKDKKEGWGDASNGVMLIGGVLEDDDDLPFTGQAGKLLEYLCTKGGIDFNASRKTNLCLCKTPKEVPSVRVVRACLPRLQGEIAKYNPSLIVLFGDAVLGAVLPGKSVTRFHGKKLKVGGVIYVVMYKPSAPLDSPYFSNLVEYDWGHLKDQVIVKVLDGEYTIGKAGSLERGKALYAVDTETDGLYGALLGGAVCHDKGKAAYFTGDSIVAELHRLDSPHLVCHNAKYDMRVLQDAGLKPKNFDVECTQLLAYCLAYDNLGLKVLETQELDVMHSTYSEVADESGSLVNVPVKDVAEYCGQDADSDFRLWDYLWKVADERERKLYLTVEKPLMPILVDMERLGVLINIDAAKQWDVELEQGIAEVTAELCKEYPLNEEILSSPKKLGEWLEGEGVKLPKTGVSGQAATGKEVLAAFIDKHPSIPSLLKRRQLTKLRSTYASAYLTLVDKANRLHTQYNQSRVVTGRLSSSDPNLQNLPYTEVARSPVIASPGNKLLRLDYKQVDMRVLAALTQDEGLLSAFRNGEDIHNWMADKVFGDHDEMHRHIIKAVSYLVLYAGGAQGLHQLLNAPMGEFDITKMGKPPSLKECRAIIAEYYDRFPGIRIHQERTKKFAMAEGYVEDYYGRRRYLPQLASFNKGIVASALRMAINMPIAGTAGSLFKLSMIRAGAIQTPVLNVHDELVFDVPEGRVDELAPELKAAMEGIEFPVPLEVSYQIGDNLGELI